MFHYVLQKVILATNSSATSVQIKSNVPRKVYQLITRNYLAKMVPDIAKTNTVAEIKCAKTNWRSNVPEITCSGDQMFRRSNVPEIKCSGDQKFRRSNVPEIKCAKVIQRSNVPEIENSGDQMFRRSNVPKLFRDQMCRRSKIPEIECSGDHMFRRSNVPEIENSGDRIFRRSNVPSTNGDHKFQEIKCVWRSSVCQPLRYV